MCWWKENNTLQSWVVTNAYLKIVANLLDSRKQAVDKAEQLRLSYNEHLLYYSMIFVTPAIHSQWSEWEYSNRLHRWTKLKKVKRQWYLVYFKTTNKKQGLCMWSVAWFCSFSYMSYVISLICFEINPSSWCEDEMLVTDLDTIISHKNFASYTSFNSFYFSSVLDNQHDLVVEWKYHSVTRSLGKEVCDISVNSHENVSWSYLVPGNICVLSFYHFNVTFQESVVLLFVECSDWWWWNALFMRNYAMYHFMSLTEALR